MAFSPDGKLLASADNDSTVRLWNPATGQPAGASLQADTPRANGATATTVNGVAFSPDGKLLASAEDDGTVRLWNPATGQEVGASLQADATGVVNGVAFSPNGELLASAEDDGTVRLWNPATGQQVGAPLQADTTGVNGVAFGPNGALLASADRDGTVEPWQVSLFADPYTVLCADVGPPTAANWTQYAPGEPQPSVCS